MKEYNKACELQTSKLLNLHIDFANVYQSYSGSLYAAIFKVVKDKSITEDLLQETFIKVWNRINIYDASKGSIYSWMVQIAKNTAIDYIRSRYFIGKVKTNNLNFSNTEKCFYISGEESFCVKQLLLLLPEKYKMILFLSYLKGHTDEEVSCILSCPLGTVKTRKLRGLNQLKKIVTKDLALPVFSGCDQT